ncbi:lipoate biosynthesis protein B; Lipoate-protein ligase B [Candidatus Methylomirabilis lanthanidiphila]|uniref:Octanoyltransferase n=1 Tax=Candidatus Methylomirabilis lanthanidiphila TaxID=2211376 RepID=A0A564ZLR3_9BACT|nr:lipoate biosynthesis protein B; Lipoate-protein ligase B [Candidatus Methylomirabilis lanthanidiphila]
MRTCSLIELGTIPYAEALTLQRRLATLRAEDRLGDMLLLVQHLPVITLGRAGQKANLRVPESSLAQMGVEFFEVERGGDMTYHGPGQLVGYPILNLTDHGRDVHRYLRQLEEVLIVTLSDFGIAAGRSRGRTGVWVGDRKIASLGIHVGRWVTRHGFALNVDMDLTPFELIVPCGIQGVRMTSMTQELCRPISIREVTAALTERFEAEFGIAFVPALLSERSDARSGDADMSDSNESAIVGGIR